MWKPCRGYEVFTLVRRMLLAVACFTAGCNEWWKSTPTFSYCCDRLLCDRHRAAAHISNTYSYYNKLAYNCEEITRNILINKPDTGKQHWMQPKYIEFQSCWLLVYINKNIIPETSLPFSHIYAEICWWSSQLILNCLITFRAGSRFVPSQEKWRYFVKTSLIGWVQAKNQPWHCIKGNVVSIIFFIAVLYSKCGLPEYIIMLPID